MTIETTNRVDEYTGTGLVDTYSYTYKIFDEEHLTVTTDDGAAVTILVLNTDYTVDGVGDDDGGNIYLTDALANGTDISIERTVPVLQLVDVRNQGRFFPETHEDKFDYLCMVDQQMTDAIADLEDRVTALEAEVGIGEGGSGGSATFTNLTVTDTLTVNDVVILGDVTFGAEASIDLPDGSIFIQHLSQEVLDLIAEGGGGSVSTTVGVALSDDGPEATALDASDTVPLVTISYWPWNLTLTELPLFELAIACDAGATTLDIHVDGVTIFSTKPTIDATEDNTEDAATASVVSSALISQGSKVEFFCDAIGDTVARGLKVVLQGTRDGQSISTGSGGDVETGTVVDFAGATPPDGFLLCNGTAVSRTTYANLFAIINTVWGAGNGTTTFNVPDLRGRTTIGAGTGSGLTSRALGNQSIGTETHTLTGAESGTVAHTHTASTGATSTGGGIPVYETSTGGYLTKVAAAKDIAEEDEPGDEPPQVGTVSVSGAHSHTVTVDAAAAANAASAHNNMQPSAVMNKIIKI